MSSLIEDIEGFFTTGTCICGRHPVISISRSYTESETWKAGVYCICGKNTAWQYPGTWEVGYTAVEAVSKAVKKWQSDRKKERQYTSKRKEEDHDYQSLYG